MACEWPCGRWAGVQRRHHQRMQRPGATFRLEEALERRLLGCRQSHGDQVSEDDVEGLPKSRAPQGSASVNRCASL